MSPFTSRSFVWNIALWSQSYCNYHHSWLTLCTPTPIYSHCSNCSLKSNHEKLFFCLQEFARFPLYCVIVTSTINHFTLRLTEKYMKVYCAKSFLFCVCTCKSVWHSDQGSWGTECRHFHNLVLSVPSIFHAHHHFFSLLISCWYSATYGGFSVTKCVADWCYIK